jgi:hypothetical protein
MWRIYSNPDPHGCKINSLIRSNNYDLNKAAALCIPNLFHDFGPQKIEVFSTLSKMTTLIFT